MTVGFGRDRTDSATPAGFWVIVATGPRVPLALHPGLRSFAPCGAGNTERFRHPCGVLVIVATDQGSAGAPPWATFLRPLRG